MNSRFTRREAVLLGTAGLAGLLAGCSGTTGGGVDPDTAPTDTASPEEGDTDGGTGGGDGGDTTPASTAVGGPTDIGGFEVGVATVERLERVPFGAFGLAADQGNEFLAVDLLLKNVSDAYTSMVVELFGVVQGEGSYGTFEPFADILNPQTGGAAFAPGELRRVRLHFEVPAGGDDARLRMVLGLRRLPGATFERLRPLEVDLESTVASPVELTQSFSDPLGSFGATVAHRGLELTIDDPVFGVEVPNESPAEGNEFLALPVSVTNGSDIPNPVLVDITALGGLSVLDDLGNVYRGRVEFSGELAGGEMLDTRNGVAPGDAAAGVAVTEVPVGAEPLYLTWTPPARFWARSADGREADATTEVNKYVWQLR